MFYTYSILYDQLFFLRLINIDKHHFNDIPNIYIQLGEATLPVPRILLISVCRETIKKKKKK